MEMASVKLPLTLFFMLAYVSFFAPSTTEARCKPHHPKHHVPAPSPAPLSPPLAPVPAPAPSLSDQLAMLGCGKTCFTTFCDWPCNHCCVNNNTCCLDPRVQGLEPGQPIPPMPPLTFMCGGFCRDSNDCGSDCPSCSTNGTCIPEEPFPEDVPPPASQIPSPLPSPPEQETPEMAPSPAPLSDLVPAPGPSLSDQLAIAGCGKTCYTTYCDWPCNHCCVNNNTCCLDPRIQGLEPGQPIPPRPPVTFRCGGFCIDSNECGSDCSSCSVNGTCVPEEPFPDDLAPPPSELTFPLP